MAATKLSLTTLEIKPGTETDMNINLVEEVRACVHGVVRLPNGEYAENAVVKLFATDPVTGNLIPVAFAFTDQFGQFLFGIEDTSLEYKVKVFHYVPENPLPTGTTS
ncbi:hypothetical protein [Desulforamulus hydrothermalis]|uniref:Uncharacterized protein n=1 Tax=Desulforamulus hydrothermalis Lam5 = DSM 18033 TaxID=1121428 RepID=K8EAB5_9FIRM|nr:hypothetical protein [Desulforamulus hydrothermalis]CCO08548.1 conserved hypothetical protein [Desulforamulus hydrothermalis Lam5 = DSM 18033]SHH02449.1 hypothetical protein SAMN02745177_01179 [Desulforamulus hydrothermalis Lam5 = DSM 18033]